MAPTDDPPDVIFSVHVTKPDNVGAIEIVFRSEYQARAYAQDRSRDFRILSASVTRFTVGELGTRHPVTWYIQGVEQPQRFDRQLYPSDGSASDDDGADRAGSAPATAFAARETRQGRAR